MKQYRLKDLSITEGSGGEIGLSFPPEPDKNGYYYNYSLTFVCKTPLERAVWQTIRAALLIFHAKTLYP